MSGMGRREFFAVLGGAAATWPLAAFKARAHRLSVRDLSARYEYRPFPKGNIGYLEGRDFVIDARFAHRDYRRFPGLVAELLSARANFARLESGGFPTLYQ
jgi:hypothetical protein